MNLWDGYTPLFKHGVYNPDGCFSAAARRPPTPPRIVPEGFYGKDYMDKLFPCNEIMLTEPEPCPPMEKHDSGTGWIGVDLDGTLAEYHGFKGLEHIGKPVPLMLERVRRWLAEGREVRIFTARASDPKAFKYIHEWLVKECKLPPLKITNIKDPEMDELWDDRVVNVIPNTGMPSNKSPRGLD